MRRMRSGPGSRLRGLAVGLVFLLAVGNGAGARAAVMPAQGPAKQTFNVYEFLVLGSHVLGQMKVEATVYPFLGPDKTIQDVEKARAALIDAYRKAGYGTVLVDIPEQSVDQGVVRLKVTEGNIDN